MSRFRTRHIRALTVIAVLALPIVVAGPAHAASPLCGTVITKNLTLQADVDNCPGDGLVVGAANITIDLNGHSVFGTGTNASSAGVRNNGFAGVTIKNGRIHDFGADVRLDGATGNRVVGLEVSDAEHGIVILSTDHTLVDANHGSGLDVNAVTVTDSDDNRISNNVVSNNLGDGIRLDNSHHNVVIRNHGQNNTFNGITMTFGSLSNQVLKNTLQNNGTADIRVSTGSESNVVKENSVGGGSVSHTGIRVLGANGNTISDNTSSLATVGIEIASGNGNQVRENTVSGATGDGIYVNSAAGQTAVRSNKATSNGDDGIDINAAGTKVKENTANNNTDLGIEGVPGVIDEGGNKASGNGNPAQCTFVACS